MKQILLFSAVLLISYNSFAQNSDYIDERQSDELSESVLSLDLLAPGITFEKAVSNYNSLVLGANAGFSFYAYENTNGESGSSFIMIPVILGQFRHYYNFDKRNDKYKVTWYNSANYVGFNISYQADPIAGDTDDFIYEPGAVIGPFWGIQRNGALTFNFYLGLGYYTGTSEVTTFGNLKVGLNLTKIAGK